ncbi:hypothetical protein [Alcanivorax xiamenensis]|nr:hypothetical protein [Alcanivorax xiamenensis]
MADKYHALYELAKEAFFEEINRLARIERKASVMISVLTIFIGAYISALQWIASKTTPPESCLEWLIIVVSAVLFGSLVFSWVLVLRVFTIDRRRVIPANNGLIEFYKQNSFVTINYGMANKFCEVTRENRGISDKKVKRLIFGMRFVLASGTIFVALGVLIAAQIWISNLK